MTADHCAGELAPVHPPRSQIAGRCSEEPDAAMETAKLVAARRAHRTRREAIAPERNTSASIMNEIPWMVVDAELHLRGTPVRLIVTPRAEMIAGHAAT